MYNQVVHFNCQIAVDKKIVKLQHVVNFEFTNIYPVNFRNYHATKLRPVIIHITCNF